MLKAMPWNGEPLLGEWVITRKLDGVRALISNGVARSRAAKPLCNLDGVPDGDYEVFDTDWSTTVSRVRKAGTPVELHRLYSLEPLDERLLIGTVVDPTSEEIRTYMADAVAAGDEGIVVRQLDTWIKVKPLETYDVEVTGSIPGKGRNEGRMGALITSLGSVGTGFTDAQREAVYPEGTIIEVSAQGLTPDGKFRFPRFMRVRFDKMEG
jgi:ATP-dependent DNA ligase